MARSEFTTLVYAAGSLAGLGRGAIGDAGTLGVGTNLSGLSRPKTVARNVFFGR